MNKKFEKLGFYPADILLPKEQDQRDAVYDLHESPSLCQDCFLPYCFRLSAGYAQKICQRP